MLTEALPTETNSPPDREWTTPNVAVVEGGDPADGESWFRRGEACRGRRDWGGAEEAFRRASQTMAEPADALNALGITLGSQGRSAEAAEAFRDAVAASPVHHQAIHNLGVAAMSLDQEGEAEQCFRKAIELSPGYATAHVSLGNCLAHRRRHAEAVDEYTRALRLNPRIPNALGGLGLSLMSVGDAERAEVYLRQAVREQPGNPGAHNNLGLALAEQGRYAEAEAAYREALRIDPDNHETHTNLGNTYKEGGRLAAAIASYDWVLWNRPDHVTARWNRSLTLLQSGRLSEGWTEYESRWDRNGGRPGRQFPRPAWDGSDLTGKTILVHTEQGLGDVVQFVRYCGLLGGRGATVVLEAPAPLRALLATCPFVHRLTDEGYGGDDFDFHISVMSLPRLFGTTLDTIPAGLPYLFPPQDRVQHWRESLGGKGGLKVGLSWQGNPHHQWDRHRSVPLSILAPLGGVPGVRLISLQRGPGTEQLAGQAAVETVLDASLPDDQAVLETAALVQALDLVITVDTAVAHLAGSLGVPVWTLLSTMVDWRWLLGREDTPWYPTMRLFRQQTRGDWGPVVRRLGRELRKRRATA